MYRVELLIQDDLSADGQAAWVLDVGTLIAALDESGLGVVGRIITVHIRHEGADALEDSHDLT